MKTMLHPEPLFSKEDINTNDLSYEELEILVKERKLLAKKSFNGSLSILFSYKSTVLHLIIFDYQVFISLIIYIAARYSLIENPSMSTLQIVPVGYIASLVSFLVVFFASQVYTRYLNLYNFSMAIEGRIFDTILLAKTLLPPSVVMRIFRHLNAAHILCYIGFAEAYKVHNLLEPLNNQYFLLDSSEISRLNAIGYNGGSAYREVLVWILRTIQYQHDAKHITDMDKQMLFDQILRFRGAIGSLYDYEDMPFPFIYVNFVYFITLVYPALFALATARYFAVATVNGDVIPEFLGALCVFINSMFIIGLRKIAYHFHRPYGNFLEDLNVVHFLQITILSSRKLLFAKKIDEVDDHLEVEMDKYRPPIGNGFTKQADVHPKKQQETMKESPIWTTLQSAISENSFRLQTTSDHVHQYLLQQSAKAELENHEIRQSLVDFDYEEMENGRGQRVSIGPPSEHYSRKTSSILSPFTTTTTTTQRNKVPPFGIGSTKQQQPPLPLLLQSHKNNNSSSNIQPHDKKSAHDKKYPQKIPNSPNDCEPLVHSTSSSTTTPSPPSQQQQQQQQTLQSSSPSLVTGAAPTHSSSSRKPFVNSNKVSAVADDDPESRVDYL